MTAPASPKRMTRQRRLVLQELRKLKNHPSADYLFGIVRQTMPNISLGTVYRNLDVLVSSGLVLKLDLAGGQCRYDGDTSPHYHIRCKCCGSVGDLPEAAVTGINGPQVLESDYIVTDWRIEFYGICPMCQGARVEQTAPRQYGDRGVLAQPNVRAAQPQLEE